jgi:hypothetical protein
MDYFRLCFRNNVAQSHTMQSKQLTSARYLLFIKDMEQQGETLVNIINLKNEIY